MLVSLDWIRSLISCDAETDEISRKLTDRGLTVDAVTRHGEDTVLELDIPANRPDCLGHVGVAREIAAGFGLPAPAPESASPSADGSAVVEIDDLAGCPRFTASVVRGIKVTPSPRWVVDRLEACGLRSVNNVVDASNLVMLETGNPIHFYDLARVQGGMLRVRRAEEGERLTTLDDIERELSADMLVIADGARAVGLAGVMGGAETEIREDTVDVLVEAAYFDPHTVRRTARKLGLHTDASHRFERGADRNGVLAAQHLARRLLTELAGGKPDLELRDLHPESVSPVERSLRASRVATLLGYRPEPSEIKKALEAVGLRPEETEEGVWNTTIPSWRVDLLREADLVEEVARDLGYDRIPAMRGEPERLPIGSRQRVADQAEERARDLLAHLGFHEAVSYAMIGPGEDEAFVAPETPAPIPLSNPLAEPLSALRRSALPGLLKALDRNVRRGTRDVRLFEIGHVFHDRSTGLPLEPARLAIVWSGASAPVHWSASVPDVGLSDLAGIVEAVISGVTRNPAPPRAPQSGIDAFHPAISAAWIAEDTPVAWAGELHPAVRDRLDLPAGIFIAEIEIGKLAAGRPGPAQYRPIPRFPSPARDLSLVLDAGVRFADIRAAVESVPSPAPSTVDLIDRYAGAPLEEGQVSLTVRLSLHPSERTLTDEETEGYRAKVVQRLEQVGGIRLRD